MVRFWFCGMREKEKGEKKEKEDVTRRPRVIDRTCRILASWQTSGGRVTKRAALTRRRTWKSFSRYFSVTAVAGTEGIIAGAPPVVRPSTGTGTVAQATTAFVPQRNKSGPVDIVTETRFGRNQRVPLQIETNQPGNNN